MERAAPKRSSRGGAVVAALRHQQQSGDERHDDYWQVDQEHRAPVEHVAGNIKGNDEPQLKFSSSHPPSAGPVAMPTAAMPVQMPIARPRSSRGEHIRDDGEG